jgi:hypothetical protein
MSVFTGIFNSEAFISCGGVNALTHALLDCSMPRISEAILGCLLRLHNEPSTRRLAKVRLDKVAAPFTEFRYIHDDPRNPQSSENEKALRFLCGRQAIVSMLHSWSGLLHLTKPASEQAFYSPLQALVNVLHFQNTPIKVRMHKIKVQVSSFSRFPINCTYAARFSVYLENSALQTKTSFCMGQYWNN